MNSEANSEALNAIFFLKKAYPLQRGCRFSYRVAISEGRKVLDAVSLEVNEGVLMNGVIILPRGIHVNAIIIRVT